MKCPGLQAEWSPLSTDATLKAALDLVPVNKLIFVAWSLGFSENHVSANVSVKQKGTCKLL